MKKLQRYTVEVQNYQGEALPVSLTQGVCKDKDVAELEEEFYKFIGIFSDHDAPCLGAGQARLIWNGMRKKMHAMEDLLRATKREHFRGDEHDEQYSCEAGYSGWGSSGECTCGAEQWNKRVDECLGS